MTMSKQRENEKVPLNITDAVTSCDGGNEIEPDCIFKWLEE